MNYLMDNLDKFQLQDSTQLSSVPVNGTQNNVEQQQYTDENIIDIKDLLAEIIPKVDQNIKLDKDVENVLLEISNDFIDELIKAACKLAKHRKSKIVEVKDVQMYLERYLNMWTPGFEMNESRHTYNQPYHKTEAHRHRMAIVKKFRKKY